MNKFPTKSAQGGFTLIELIVVIVILGILAATALPKFASLGGDARIASLNAAKGAMTATAAMTHGKFLITPSITSLTVEGTSVGITNGYPTANTNFAAAAGLGDADYRIDTPATGTVRITPRSVVGNTGLEASCHITYTEAATGNQPTYAQGATPLVCE